MKKAKAFLAALLLCTSITGCSGSNVNTASETTADTTVSETISTIETTTVSETTTEPETTTLTETTTEETTTVPETTAETAETTEDGKLVSPSGWVLDKELPASELNDDSQPETNKVYYICTLENGANIYGIIISDNDRNKQYTIIEQDGIIDELERNCIGCYSEPLKCKLFDLDNDGEQEIFSESYESGGMMTCKYDMVIFKRNESKHYEMITVTGSPTYSYQEVNDREHELLDEINSKINIEWAVENESVRIFTDDSEYIAELNEYSRNDLNGYTNEDLQKDMGCVWELSGYSVTPDNKVIYRSNVLIDRFIILNYSVGIELIYSDGSFTMGNVILEW